MKPMLPITTSRLVLRDFVAEDWQAVHAYASDPEVVRYMPFGPNTQQESRDFIERMLADQAEGAREALQPAVTLKDGGSLIGACRIGVVAGVGLSEASLGYTLRRTAWGHGYATEAARALVALGFDTMGVHRVHATCDVDNIASARVLEKLGMHREGLLRENVRLRTGWRDSYLYAIVESDWQAAQNEEKE